MCEKPARTLIQEIASTCQAIKNCSETGNDEWYQKHLCHADELNDLLPSGSGIDGGSTIYVNKSDASKVVIYASYHLMDENGFYVGWLNFTIEVTPSFFGVDIDITFDDFPNIDKLYEEYPSAYGLNDYLHQTFDMVLNSAYNPA